MGDRARIAGALLCGICAIGVDFTSTLLSVASDLLFIGGVCVLLFPLLKDKV